MACLEILWVKMAGFVCFWWGGGEIATTVTKSFTRNKAKIYMKAKGKILDKLEEYFLCCWFGLRFMILIIFSCSFDDTTRFELSLKQLVFVFKFLCSQLFIVCLCITVNSLWETSLIILFRHLFILDKYFPIC